MLRIKSIHSLRCCFLYLFQPSVFQRLVFPVRKIVSMKTTFGLKSDGNIKHIWYSHPVWSLLIFTSRLTSNCYRMVPSAIRNIFRVSHILQFIYEIIAKYEKRGKYLPIWHKAMCDNSFIVKCYLKSNVSRIMYLLTVSRL